MPRILICFFTLLSFFSRAQEIYKVNIERLEVGNYLTDSTTIWKDSILSTKIEVDIFLDSLVKRTEIGSEVYAFISPKETNPGVTSFYSRQLNSQEPFTVTFFTSPCLDKSLITIIIETDVKSYNFYGVFQ